MNAPATDNELARKGAADESVPACFDRRIVCVLGLPFDTLSLARAVERLRAAAFSNTRCFVSTPNLNFLITAQRDPVFRDSVLRSDLSLPDGMPIVWIARLLGLPIAERVAGASVFEALRAHPGPPITVFFFGGPPGVAEAACRNLNRAATGLRCVGFDEAGYGSVEELSSADRIAKINGSGAQFVIVALGAKKGQAWIERNATALHAPLLCHLGAVVNFVAGGVARAPLRLQRFGLEWLWRIKEEPELWPRYRRDGAAICGLVLRRVLPYAVHLRLGKSRTTSKPGRGRQKSPSLQVLRRGEDGVQLKLDGAWTEAALPPLRDVLEDATTTGTCVALWLGDVDAVDNAFVALLLLARGRLGRANLRLLQARPTVRSIFWFNAAEFLLEPPHID